MNLKNHIDASRQYFIHGSEYRLLTSMWSSRIRRQLQLIVPEVTHNNGNGSLHNENWAFRVPYAFRSAMDISYDQRIKHKKPYMVWTQGPCLSFKEGDMLVSQNGNFSYQVQDAQPMKWNDDKNEMYEGFVTFTYFGIKGIEPSFKLVTCSQMEFLGLLIYGG